MGLPLTGELSLDDVNVELGITSGTTIRMGSSAVRGLFERSSGSVGMQHGRGKSNSFAFNITGNAKNADIRALAITAGWDGDTSLVANVNANVWLYSDSTSTGGTVLSGSFPSGVTIVNNGNMIGMGGAANSAGGPALQVTTTDAVSVINNSGAYIAGGGGGGGGTFTFTSAGYPGHTFTAAYGGGGAGQSGALGGTSTTSGGHGWMGIWVDSTIGHSCSGSTNNTNSLGANPARGYGYGGGGGSGTFAGRTSYVYTSGSCAGRMQGNNYYYGGAAGGRALTGGSTGTASGNAGGFWGQAGGSGGGAGGAAVSGTSVTMTNNGTVYGTVA